MFRAVLFSVLLFPVILTAGNTFGKTFGGAENDVGYSAVECPNHDFILIGYTKSFNGTGLDGYLVRITNAGDLVWQKNFDLGQDELFRSGALTANSGLLLVGYCRKDETAPKDLLIVKVNASGEMQWQKCYGGDGNDYACEIQKTPDGNFVISGTTNSFGHGGEDVWVLKVDSNGDTLWTATFGSTGDDQGRGCAVDASGNIYVSAKGAGVFAPDLYFIKLHGDGSAEWLKSFSTMGWTEGYDVCMSDTTAIFAGYGYWGSGYSHDMLWVKTTTMGDTIQTGHGGGSKNDYAFGISAVHHGGFILAGKTYSFGGYWKGLLWRVDSQGETKWKRAFGGDKEDIFWNVLETDDQCYLAVGYTNSTGNGASDLFVVKVDSTGEATAIPQPARTLPSQFTLGQNYPNPFNPTTTIPVRLKKRGQVQVEIFNSNGAKVAVLGPKNFNAGTHNLIWNARGLDGKLLPSGIYIYRLWVNGKYYAHRKMILLR